MTRKRKVDVPPRSFDDNDQQQLLQQEQEQLFAKRNRGHEQNSAPSATQFPTELLNYLRQLLETIESEPGKDDDDILFTRAIEEIGDQLSVVFGFSDSIRVVERLFTKSQVGAVALLSVLARQKRRFLADLMSRAAAIRTIEALIYKLHPLSVSKHVELVAGWIELVEENWDVALRENGANRFVRALLRICAGLSPASDGKAAAIATPAELLASIAPESRRLFDQIARRALDFASMGGRRLAETNASFLVQEAITAEISLKATQNTARFVDAALAAAEGDGGNAIRHSWTCTNASRAWEQLILGISDGDDGGRLEKIYRCVVKDHEMELARDLAANWPLRKLIENTRHKETVCSLLDAYFSPLVLNELLASHRINIILAIVSAVERHEKLQTGFLKTLRTAFNAAKEADKFVANVLAWNCGAGGNFETEKAEIIDGQVITANGVRLLEALVTLKHNKTVVVGLQCLPDETKRKMMSKRTTSRLFEKFVDAKTVSDEEKNKLADLFESSWPTLAFHNDGKFAFLHIWTWADESRRAKMKEQIVEKANAVRGTPNWAWLVQKIGLEDEGAEGRNVAESNKDKQAEWTKKQLAVRDERKRKIEAGEKTPKQLKKERRLEKRRLEREAKAGQAKVEECD